MKIWAILGSGRPTIYFKHNNGGVGCNYKFNNSFFDVWCVIEYEHHSTHQHPNYNLTNYGAKFLMELGFCQRIEFDTST
jgi:hypothetical protein